MATKEEIDKLIRFIGGFEKWSILNEDCRGEVVKYLDYKSRCHLERCSKRDYATVEKIPLFVYGIEVRDDQCTHLLTNEDEFDCDFMAVKIFFDDDYHNGKQFELTFCQQEEDTLIQWFICIPRRRAERRKVVWKSCNYREESLKFAESWMKRCNYELRSLKVVVSNYPIESSKIKMLPCCKDVDFFGEDIETLNWWLSKVPEQLEDLVLSGEPLAELRNEPKIYKATGCLCYSVALTDEEFLKLNAKKIRIEADLITDTAINQFIKKWVNGEGPKNFKEVILWTDRKKNEDVLINGLKIQLWDDDFEEEEDAFCDDYARINGRGLCYQIKSLFDSYESLTLNVMDNRIAVDVTGKKVIRDGKTFTEYLVR